jgi:hypothetical protein
MFRFVSVEKSYKKLPININDTVNWQLFYKLT